MFDCHYRTLSILGSLVRCSSLVQVGVRPFTFHAATGPDSRKRDENERTHGHPSTPSLITLPQIHCLEPRPPSRMCDHQCCVLKIEFITYVWSVFIFYIFFLVLRWSSSAVARWHLWRLVLKVDTLLAQARCSSHRTPRRCTAYRCWWGIQGNSSGHINMTSYHFLCNNHFDQDLWLCQQNLWLHICPLIPSCCMVFIFNLICSLVNSNLYVKSW